MAVPAEQLILMGCLFLIGLLLNGVAYRWWQSEVSKYRYYTAVRDA
ncbi:MAG: hypothetical protein F6J97_13600 [Leptolyngbya sp. SIO4C1]|nr:hypothetical protein [Leptolyngbya sp. SIO4C1]